MSAISKIREWVKTYDQYSDLSDLRVDYAEDTENGADMSGLKEVTRKMGILGDVTVTNQYAFALYLVFAPSDGEEAGTQNYADWVVAFQEWVQEQSIMGQAPVFGDLPRDEKIVVENGTLYNTDGEGTVTYKVKMSVEFKKYYEEKNKWLK